MQDVALDACCLINLCAAGKILGAVSPSAAPRRGGRRGAAASPKPGSGLGLNLHVPSKVSEEILYVLQPDVEDTSKLVKSPIDLEHFTAAGLLHKCDFEGQEEIELFVQMAIPLGDGEAACFAIAAKRGWALATDDRRARKFAADSSLAVITTPELVKLWAKNTHASDEQIVAVLQNIQRFAYFTPRANAPEYGWWMSCLGQDPR
jgi:predicted nucleic acid-binding protein